MLCRHCHRDNPPGNAFCSSCGASLAGSERPAAAQAGAERLLICPRCNAGNRPNMRFCRECGTALESAAYQASSAAPPRPSARPAASAPSGAFAPVAVSPPAQPAQSALTCARCGGAGDPGSRFCKFCGSPLEAAAQAPVPSRPPAPQGAPASRPAPARGRPRAQVVVILRNGSEGRVYPLDGTQTDIGSREGEILLNDDPFLSARHARIEVKGDNYVLRDLGSINGIYARIKNPVELVDADMILVGQQVLIFKVLTEAERRIGPARQQGVMIFGTPEVRRSAKLVQYTTEGLERDVHYLCREETVLGREQADVVFPDDPFLSRRHAAIAMSKDEQRFTLRDLGSSNGTAVRCRGERVLQAGDQFRLGRHLFRFDLVYG
jgi:pSer/pThr/pTyr-binding forkhead associated (FHA) protein/ribosomal protein L40E